MASSRLLSRSLLNIGGRVALFSSAFGWFYSNHPITKAEFSPTSTLSLLGTLIGAASTNIRQFSPAAVTAVRGYATVTLEGCDFKHWHVAFKVFSQRATRDEIIDTYIKTLAMVMGRMKIYSISTRDAFSVGVLASEELAKKIEKLPGVRYVFPDCYVFPKEQRYGGEPFINGHAGPFDPKYNHNWEREPGTEHPALVIKRKWDAKMREEAKKKE